MKVTMIATILTAIIQVTMKATMIATMKVATIATMKVTIMFQVTISRLKLMNSTLALRSGIKKITKNVLKLKQS